MISHDLAAVERLCSLVLLVDHTGCRPRVPRDVIAKSAIAFSNASAERDQDDALSRDVEIASVTCCDADGRRATTFDTEAQVTVRVQYLTHRPVSCAVFELYFLAVIGGAFVPWYQLITASISGGDGARTWAGGRPVRPAPVELEAGDVLPERNDHGPPTPGTDIDSLHQCLTLRIDQGRFTRGSFICLIGGGSLWILTASDSPRDFVTTHLLSFLEIQLEQSDGHSEPRRGRY